MADSFSSPRDFSRRKERLFNAEQLALVRELGELIIPATDTPGAIGAEVHHFIDHQAACCLSAQEQESLIKGLQRINSTAEKLYGKAFLSCTQAQRVALLTQMEQAQGEFTAQDRAYFKQFKGLVLLGYYTSEIGASKELAYLAIPGGYKGSVKFSTVGKAWAFNF